jgi:hypothetical protein
MRMKKLTGHVSRVGVPIILKMLPISVKSLCPPSNKDLLLMTAFRGGAHRYAAKPSDEAGDSGASASIGVKKLAMVAPRDQRSRAKGSYPLAPNSSSGARYALSDVVSQFSWLKRD